MYCVNGVTRSTPTPQSVPGQRKAGRPTGGKRLVGAAVVLVTILVTVDALVGDGGLFAMRRARRQYDELTAALARKKAENDRLREQVRRLQEDPSAIEELARRELGLIRSGEKVFIIKDLAPPH